MLSIFLLKKKSFQSLDENWYEQAAANVKKLVFPKSLRDLLKK